MLLLYLSVYFTFVCGRDCVDSDEGVCEANDLFGWCFHDKISGSFNCDSSRYCANQESIRAKLNSTGCFERANDDIKCCCNEADMCNYNFLNTKPKTRTGFQSCIYAYEKSETAVTHFKNCIDPWCIAYFKYDENGKGSVLRGCQSRAMYRFKADRQASTRIANRIYFDELDDFLEQPRCNQFASEDDKINGTVVACLDLFAQKDNKQKIARLCCCRGNDECNAEIGEDELGKTIDEIKFDVEKIPPVSDIKNISPFSAKFTPFRIICLVIFFQTS